MRLVSLSVASTQSNMLTGNRLCGLCIVLKSLKCWEWEWQRIAVTLAWRVVGKMLSSQSLIRGLRWVQFSKKTFFLIVTVNDIRLYDECGSNVEQYKVFSHEHSANRSYSSPTPFWNQQCSVGYQMAQRLSDFSFWRAEMGFEEGLALWHLV